MKNDSLSHHEEGEMEEKKPRNRRRVRMGEYGGRRRKYQETRT